MVIATPSALHAAQAMGALERGMSVFCQKPLGRTQNETRAVLEVARKANRLLAVDLSYRFICGTQALLELIRSGELGEIYAIEAAFHNAYGPDKPWFYDRELSGGGCVIDLGIHLIDLVLWMLAFPRVIHVTSRLFSQGQPWRPRGSTVEDYATARVDLATGASVQVACSWRAPAGQDAVIQVIFYGTRGGACLRNVNGSFYEFTAERLRGTSREVLTTGADEWGSRAAMTWAKRLSTDWAFDPEIQKLDDVAGVLDRMYAQQQGS